MVQAHHYRPAGALPAQDTIQARLASGTTRQDRARRAGSSASQFDHITGGEVSENRRASPFLMIGRGQAMPRQSNDSGGCGLT